ncbi:NADH dehydrogenase (quinone), G subunit [Candidatus Endolissoclinum faulkneri L2]|uniref:NADH-quinone oxidoreductase n=1 Tax=Candidatus Endolissoclinum faulkneri L2 TaxID=1193729 RepID=K7Z449_9PROT|nr:NADH-quinone oxidoreductase subunit NuoG [Candidatus Endolissoclinum faulkneri]AFX98788.1 NADH dehydrogenase (quinone), G subunit [Candidatus Endolissoclinum faulkneri L2]
MPRLMIDGIETVVPQGATVLQACESVGSEVPHFCFHSRLSIAGNCRMCLVELENGSKPIVACAFPAEEGMVIQTKSDLALKAQKSTMEFLLINHPLDCPICDQGGECDLQDQAMGYGFHSSRYRDNKRAVTNKYMGPLIKTIMTRCIHCTRCVRFSTEIAGVKEMGMLNRGEGAEITTYLEEALNSELSANVIDLCPVGALTSKPYAFVARPWELKKINSIDVMDAVGSSIRIDTRGSDVLRILPRLHEDVNEDWISDKTRYACDGLKQQRLDRPYVRKNGKLESTSWSEALTTAALAIKNLQGRQMAAIVGDLVDAESMYTLKRLMNNLECPNIDCRQDGAKVGGNMRAAYLFNTTIAGIEYADAILMVGTNPRWESALINARIRKRWMAGPIDIALIGKKVNLNYDYDHIGVGPKTLVEIMNGSHSFANILNNAKRPMIIVGMGALARSDGSAILDTALKIASNTGMLNSGHIDNKKNSIPIKIWNGFNVLHTAASRVAGLDMGFLPHNDGRDVAGIIEGVKSGTVKLVYLLGADEVDSDFGDAFVIYQGHHGDRGAHIADVIFPGAAYTEKDGIYVNTEGRIQMGIAAVFPPGQARDDWKILRALSERVGETIPFSTLECVRSALCAEYPTFSTIDAIQPAKWGEMFGTSHVITDIPFTYPINNFYMTDVISRASRTMSECTEAFVLQRHNSTCLSKERQIDKSVVG